jgi:folate-binding Fe-S cluster repair protein YgfZ
MSSPSKTPSPDYLAAIESVAYYSVPDPGYLHISGETHREYIQRQTTNDIGLLTPTRALPTLLTSPTGRIQEYYTLLDNGDAIAMLTQPGHGLGNAAYFQKRVFFNDKVVVEDQSGQWLQLEIHGSQAPNLLTQFGFSKSPEIDEVTETEWQGARIRVLGITGFADAAAFLLIVPSLLRDQLTKLLSDYPALSSQTREILRIRLWSHALRARS